MYFTIMLLSVSFCHLVLHSHEVTEENHQKILATIGGTRLRLKMGASKILH